MTRQTRTIAVVALCVLVLHVGALWALQRGLLVRPHTVSPPIPMQVRLVKSVATPHGTPAEPDARRTREAALSNPAPPRRPPRPPRQDWAPAKPLVSRQPEPALAAFPPGISATLTPMRQPEVAEPTPMSANATVAPAPATSASPGPATETGVFKLSGTTDAAATGPTSASVAMTAPASPATRRNPAAVELPSSDAYYLQNPPPRYPPISRQLREQGTVLVSVLVTDQGLALEARIQTSSGFFRLDNAAVSTVSTWRFVPGKRAGVAQSMWFTVPIVFQLQ